MILLAFASQDQVLVCCHYVTAQNGPRLKVTLTERTKLLPKSVQKFFVIHLPVVEEQMCGSTSCFDKVLVEAFIIFRFHGIDGPEQRIFSDVTHGFSFHVLHIIDMFRVPWKLRNCRGAC